MCDDESFIKKFVNMQNANIVMYRKWNVLHYACATNNLSIVKNVIKYGGPIAQTQDWYCKYPSDWTYKTSIKEYLEEIEQ